MITVEEVNKAQELWGAGIVKIGELKSSFKECRMYALDFIKKMYNFDDGSVQFKPTKAADSQFRNDLKGALSYFVADDSDYNEDGGFAINPWTKVEFQNNSINIYDDIAIAMGNYFFTNNEGTIMVEFSFVYRKDDQGNLKIILHDSHLPYQK